MQRRLETRAVSKSNTSNPPFLTQKREHLIGVLFFGADEGT